MNSELKFCVEILHTCHLADLKPCRCAHLQNIKHCRRGETPKQKHPDSRHLLTTNKGDSDEREAKAKK